MTSPTGNFAATAIWLGSGLGAAGVTAFAVRVGLAERQTRKLAAVNTLWGRSLDPDRDGGYDGVSAASVFVVSWVLLFLALAIGAALFD